MGITYTRIKPFTASFFEHINNSVIFYPCTCTFSQSQDHVELIRQHKIFSYYQVIGKFKLSFLKLV